VSGGGLAWAALMRAGMAELRLLPEVFWALTPAELRLLLGDRADRAPLLAEGLAALMAAYPDKGAAEGGSDDRRG
jgi:uncharacterized phage protein (TIGR02216 family)